MSLFLSASRLQDRENLPAVLSAPLDYDGEGAWSDAVNREVAPLGQEAEGREAIVAFFEGSPPWGKGWAALAPTYKTVIEISGNRAEFAFECVYVPDTGNLGGGTIATPFEKKPCGSSLGGTPCDPCASSVAGAN